jgi:hypothetical protein
MSLEELSLDSGEWSPTSAESPSEKSEQQKESSRRAQAQLQKIQKDEKKAKTDNDDLFQILSRFIKNPLYEDLIGDIIKLLEHNYPSRFLMAIIALVFPEAAYYVLEKTEQEDKKSLLVQIQRYEALIAFDNDMIHPSLRDWVTAWMTATEKFLCQETASTLLNQKLERLLSSDEQKYARNSIAKIFQFFFREKNVDISLEKSLAYTDFILAQLKKSLEENLKISDPDILEDREVEGHKIFGV